MSYLRLRLVAAVATTLAFAVVGSAGAAPSELFFSEYVEGSSNNKALEISNGTGAPIDLAAGAYNVQMYFNGSASAGLTVNLAGTVASGDVFVLAHSSANAAILAQADQTSGSGFFNGDDAVVLRKGSTILDVIGVIGTDPGAEWGTGLTSTADNTLRRKAALEAGDPNGADAFDPAVEWDGYAADTFDGLGFHTPPPPGDTAPSVSATTPAAGATGIARAANVQITFSEPVDATGSWFTITCATSGAHPAAVSGGPTTFTLDPATDFAGGESCTVRIVASAVTDRDTADPPDAMAADHVFGFTTVAGAICGDPATKIHAVQGPGSATPISGQTVTVEGVVVGDFQGSGQFNGYFVQEEAADADADPATSEGVFVFAGSSGMQVDAGEVVRVTGRAGEFSGMTQLSSLTSVLRCGPGSVPATPVGLPVSSVDDHERVEGMLVRYDQRLTVTEVFGLGRFGEVSLSGAGRLYNPTAVAMPGADAQAVSAQNARSRIVLDDAFNTQNLDPTRYPQGGLSASNTLRVGDTADPGITGVLEYRFNAYRIQPVGDVTFSTGNPRTSAPAPVGGNLKVASFNVLNYFNGDGLGGGFPTARGASTAAELQRQQAKIVSALTAIDADVVGLMEIENDGGSNQAIAQLVDALNAATAAGTYAYVDTGVIGTDQIRVALIYKAGKVAPVGAWKILTEAADPRFDTTRNRPALAQTFRHSSSGQVLTVAVNHLKSKGSGCGAGDDQPDYLGGNCNGTRTQAAAALADWLQSDPTGSGDPDVLIIGDLNAYTMETPIQALEADGFTNLVRQFNGLTAYSYVFNGESGYLDHALGTASAAAQVTGVTEWHINPDEPISLDYNVEFKSANHQTTLYDSGPYRASDHDPVVIGLQMNHAPTASFEAPATALVGEPFALALEDAADVDTPGDTSGLRYAFDCGSGYGAFTTNATATCTTMTVGPLSVGGKVRDAAGAVTEYRGTVNVVVTFTRLCALVQEYVDNAGIANALCAKLDAAAAKSDRKSQEADLKAFVNQVEAQSGESMTAAEAATLIRLAGNL